MPRQALEGIRILDLTQVAVGPYSTLMLGLMGAQVIKVESNRRPDTSRGAVKPRANQVALYPGQDPGERPWNRSAHLVHRNRYKLGITLDATSPEGKALFMRLAAQCDALMENYRASVIDRWGLSYAVLSEVNPQLVYLKLSSQGNTGPERDYGSLGSTMECTGGLASITGYRDGVPLMTNETYPDPVAGVLAVGALLAGLRYRRRTGRGVFIDFSQREVTTCLLGDAVLDYTMNGRIQAPTGNRHPTYAPHGVYPCQGEDCWIAIAVRNDQEWQGLQRALGGPAWASDPMFADASGRWHHQEALDAHLSAWSRGQEHYQAMHLLQAHGVPAGAALKGREVAQDPHLEARDWWDRTVYPEVGRAYSYISTPWMLSKSPRGPGVPAPGLGEHNGFVYSELLGVSEEELQRLEERGVIATEPLWEPAM
ncbi:MAG: CoA transferase [Chloroflexi bacterium]|nr:CoA transferase [Chloroflexota bacterium]